MTNPPSSDRPPVAIITGASAGLGLALATRLVRDGWHVVADARDGTRLTAAMRAFGDAATAVPGDVGDAAHRSDLVRAAGAAGGLDLLVHNASTLGATPLPRLADYPVEALAQVFATNVVAPVALTQQALELLTRGTGRAAPGTVLAITSDASVEAYEGWGGYGSSKAALDHVIKVLAAEQPDLRVYAVDPGDLRTRMHQDAFPGEDISDRPLPATVVPRLMRLVRAELPSGPYRASDLPPVETTAPGHGTPGEAAVPA